MALATAVEAVGEYPIVAVEAVPTAVVVVRPIAVELAADSIQPVETALAVVAADPIGTETSSDYSEIAGGAVQVVVEMVADSIAKLTAPG